MADCSTAIASWPNTCSDPLIPHSPSVILINSAMRGGAGGISGYPAWASIGSDDWQAVCVHEIGHGLGLADEYLDKVRESEDPQGEPNVSVHETAGLAPWSDQITVAPEAGPLDEQDGLFVGVIGTFAGARYRVDLYRPMRDCIMRSTSVQQFCDVCANAITRRLGDNV